MKGLAYLAALLLGATPLSADVTVFAAASLKEPLDAVAAEVGGVTVSYAGSGTLARQVSLGAPADVVILANSDWMDVLDAGGHVTDRVDLLSNRLVLVSGSEGTVPLTPEGLLTALGDGRLAMGFTGAVPAGIYGKAALEALGLWDTVAVQVAEVDNVRAALTLVARGEVPLGVVYATDARVVPALHVVATFPPDSHPPIRYVAALASANPDADAFLTYLQTDDGMSVFEAAGFLPIPE